MADQVRRTFPSVIPPLFLLHTCYHHQWTFIIGVPPQAHSICLPPRWDLRTHWMGPFTWLFLRVVFFTAAEGSQSASVPPARWHKGYIWSMRCEAPSMETHATTNGPVVCAHVFVCATSRQTEKPGVDPSCQSLRGPDKAAQLCPTDAPNSPFLHSALYALWNLTL